MISHEERLRGLVETGVVLTSELSARRGAATTRRGGGRPTGARYAALGVIDRDGEGLERFLTTWISEEQARRSGRCRWVAGSSACSSTKRTPPRLPRPDPGSAVRRVSARPPADADVSRGSDRSAAWSTATCTSPRNATAPTSRTRTRRSSSSSPPRRPWRSRSPPRTNPPPPASAARDDDEGGYALRGRNRAATAAGSSSPGVPAS